MHNLLDLNYNNETLKNTQLGINLDGSENTIAALGKKSILIRIPTCFSRTYAIRRRITADDFII